ncbi:MAG: hypothetical protein U0167_15280 [bacterium]
MTHHRSPASQCTWCGKPIDYGNAAVAIMHMIKQDERDGTTTVIQAESLITLCGSCGNRLDADALTEALDSDVFRLPDPEHYREPGRVNRAR